MTTETIDNWIIRGFLVFLAGMLALVVAIAIPTFLIPDQRGDWTGSDAAAAKYARSQVLGAGGAAERLVAIQTSVVEIEPDPSGCDWGYGEPVASIVTVRTHTIFGLPAGTWIVDCTGPQRP